MIGIRTETRSLLRRRGPQSSTSSEIPLIARRAGSPSRGPRRVHTEDRASPLGPSGDHALGFMPMEMDTPRPVAGAQPSMQKTGQYAAPPVAGPPPGHPPLSRGCPQGVFKPQPGSLTRDPRIRTQKRQGIDGLASQQASHRTIEPPRKHRRIEQSQCGGRGGCQSRRHGMGLPRARQHTKRRIEVRDLGQRIKTSMTSLRKSLGQKRSIHSQHRRHAARQQVDGLSQTAGRQP